MQCGSELQKNVLLLLKVVSTLGGWTAIQCGPYLVSLSSMLPVHLSFNFNNPKSVISLLIRSFLGILFQYAVSWNLKWRFHCVMIHRPIIPHFPVKTNPIFLTSSTQQNTHILNSPPVCLQVSHCSVCMKTISGTFCPLLAFRAHYSVFFRYQTYRGEREEVFLYLYVRKRKKQNIWNNVRPYQPAHLSAHTV
jgi:hypothetical protein